MTNVVFIKGNLGSDPEFHEKGGKQYVHLSVASTERFYNEEARSWESSETQWFRCIGFKPLIIDEARNLKKGCLVRAEGKLKHREYTDKQGNRRESVDIVLNNVEELVRRKTTNKQAA